MRGMSPALSLNVDSVTDIVDWHRYSVLGNEDFGYTMLHRAIEMAEELGIVNSEKLSLSSSQLSEEMIRSIQRTAWGIFQIDT